MAGFDRYIQNNESMKGFQKRLQDRSAEKIIMIDIDRIDDMPENELYFPYDRSLIEALKREFKENGFHDPVIVVPNKDRYLLVSGHQRKIAMLENGETKIPAYIRQDLSEKQIRDLWRSANIIHRKSTPLRTALLIASYESDYDKYKIGGGKRKYVAEKVQISESQVDRYKVILKMPEGIKKLCDEQDFPFQALSGAVKFTEDQKSKLQDLINARESKHPDLAWKASDIKKLIDKIEEDAKYDDDTLQIETGSGVDTSVWTRKNYEQFKLKIDEELKKKGRSHTEMQVIDKDIAKKAMDLYEEIFDDYFLVLNNNTVRNSLCLLKECISIIDKKMK